MHIKARLMVAVVLAVILAYPAMAWGPRTQAGIVSTAMNLLSKSGAAPLRRLADEITQGSTMPTSEIEIAYPDLVENPLHAVESEMALLTAARQQRVDAYFAYRMGALGKVIAMIASPMRKAPVTYRNQYNDDTDKAINSVKLKETPRKLVDPKAYFERALFESRANDDVILKQYQDGVGFKGIANAMFAADTSRAVAAVCDVWWTVLSSPSMPGGVSEAQLQRYVLDAYAFFIRRHNESEIDATNAQYSKITTITPDMRAKIGDMLLEAGLQDRAIREYETVIASSPDRRDVIQKVSDFYVAKGEASLKENKLEEARASFERAAKANPLHDAAESRRLEAENLILERDGRLASQQSSVQRAADLRDLAEQEASKGRYAESIAFLQQAEAAYNDVTEEFPGEYQQRTRALRDIQDRMTKLKESLTANAMSYSGLGFGPDVRQTAASGAKGLENDVLKQLLMNQYKNELENMTNRMQGEFSTKP